MATGLFRTRFSSRKRPLQETSLLGNVRPVDRGDPAADDPATSFGHRTRGAAGYLALDHPPGGTVGKQRGQDGVVELVAATYRAVGAEQRQTRESKVTNHVQHLVAGAFVGVAQAFGVEQPLLVEHDGVVERGAERIAGAPEPRDIAHQTESPGPADFAAETLRVEVEGVALLADDRIGEVNLDLGAEPVGIGPDLTEGVADLDRDRLQNLNEAALCRLGH